MIGTLALLAGSRLPVVLDEYTAGNGWHIAVFSRPESAPIDAELVDATLIAAGRDLAREVEEALGA